MSQELRDAFEAVKDSVNASMSHYQIWFTLRGKGKAIEEYLNNMNDHRFADFFFAANIGHYKLMFIEIACLFDSESRSHGIRKLKSLMRVSGLSDLANKFDSQLQPYSDLVSNIKTVRSKLIAHKDVGIDEKDLYKKHGIKPDEIKKLVDTIASLMRELETALTGDASYHTVGPTDRWENATYNLLAVLKAGRRS